MDNEDYLKSLEKKYTSGIKNLSLILNLAFMRGVRDEMIQARLDKKDLNTFMEQKAQKLIDDWNKMANDMEVMLQRISPESRAQTLIEIQLYRNHANELQALLD